MSNILNDINIVEFSREEFNRDDEGVYIERFNKLKEKGYFKEDDEFLDWKWTQIIGGQEKSVIFPNEIILYKIIKVLKLELEKHELDIAYRTFVLKTINKRVYLRSTIGSINKISKGIENFYMLKSGDIQKILEFIKYLRVNEEISELIEKYYVEQEETKENRILPNFDSVFKFNNIIDDVIESKLYLYLEYIPIILWWKITSVLPLRPSEFISIKYNCIYEENNQYFLLVRRSLGKEHSEYVSISEVDSYYREEKICIEKKSFDLIKKCQKIIKENLSDEEEFLNSYRFIKKGETERILNKKKFVATDLYIMLKRFYREVIETECGYKSIYRWEKSSEENIIEKLTPYDTRHIAIINLINLGYDILTVMKLAGHKEISTTEGYYNHYESFTEAYSISYAKQLEKINDININQIDDRYMNNKAVETFISIKNKKFKPIRVDYGYCSYINVEIDDSVCNKNKCECPICIYFISDNNKVIEDAIIRKKQEISSEIKVLSDIVKDRNIYKFETKCFTISGKIREKSKEIGILISKLKR